VANIHRKKCSTLSAVGEVHIKNIMRYHHSPSRMAILIKNDQSSKDREEVGLLYSIDENVKKISNLEKSFSTPQIFHSKIYPKEIKPMSI
jgi:hypothetical protein